MSIFIEGFKLPKHNKNAFKDAPMHYTCHLYIAKDNTAVMVIGSRNYHALNVDASCGNLIKKDDVVETIRREVCITCNDNVAGRCTGSDSCGVLKALNIVASAPTINKTEEKA